jgi:hypothetical protein
MGESCPVGPSGRRRGQREPTYGGRMGDDWVFQRLKVSSTNGLKLGKMLGKKVVNMIRTKSRPPKLKLTINVVWYLENR